MFLFLYFPNSIKLSFFPFSPVPLGIGVPPSLSCFVFLSLSLSLQVFPKAPKLQASQATLARQDTIDEGGEVDSSPPSRESRVVIEGSSTPATVVALSHAAKERNLALERERQIEMASSRATTSDTYDTGLREQPPTLAQRDLIATVLDLKVDVRLELQRMQQRIGRIEDMLGELVKRLQHDSSGQTTPADDNVCVCGSSTAATAASGSSSGGLVGRRPEGGATHSTATTPAADTVITISTAPPTPAIGVGGAGSGVGVGATSASAAPTSTGAAAAVAVVATTAAATGSSNLLTPVQMVPTTGSGGNGLGPLMLKKRRSKSRKAPAPPKQTHSSAAATSAVVQSPEQQRLLEEELPTTQQQQQSATATLVTTASGSGVQGTSTSTTSGTSSGSGGGGGGRTKRDFL